MLQEVSHLREKLNYSDENYIRLENENAEAQSMSSQLRDEVLRKKNELIKEQKQNDHLKKDLDHAQGNRLHIFWTFLYLIEFFKKLFELFV